MMAKESAANLGKAGSLDALGAAVSVPVSAARPAPVHQWNPPFCGDIDMRIASDGTWFYAGTPIGRPALVRLFASVLRLDPDGYMLVTPVEKVRIMVEDAPFVAVEMTVEDAPVPTLHFRTNLDEWIAVDAQHPLTVQPGAADGIKPYVEVRHGLRALVKRAVFYDLVERGEVRLAEGVDLFGVASSGLFFPIAPAAALEGLM